MDRQDNMLDMLMTRQDKMMEKMLDRQDRMFAMMTSQNPLQNQEAIRLQEEDDAPPTLTNVINEGFELMSARFDDLTNLITDMF